MVKLLTCHFDLLVNVHVVHGQNFILGLPFNRSENSSLKIRNVIECKMVVDYWPVHAVRVQNTHPVHMY